MIKVYEFEHPKDQKIIRHVEEQGQFVCFGEFKPTTFQQNFIKFLLLLFIITPLASLISIAFTMGIYIIVDFITSFKSLAGDLLDTTVYATFLFFLLSILFLVSKRIFKSRIDLDDDDVMVFIKDSDVALNNRTYQIHSYLLEEIINHYK